MRGVAWALLSVLAGCGAAEPCDAFPDESCVTLEVRGAGLRDLDQLRVSAIGFALTDGKSPDPPRRFTLPALLALLPGARYVGAFDLEVRGFFDGILRGQDDVRGAIDRPGQHLRLVATLADLTPTVDDFAFELPDLAFVPGTWRLEPLPLNSFLNGLWGSSPSDIYAVGSGGIGNPGVIVHSTGDGDWQKQTHPGEANESFDAVFGSSANDIYASAFDTVYHSTGNGVWSPQIIVPPPNLMNIGVRGGFGFSSSNLYLAGIVVASGPAPPVYHTIGDGNWTPQGTPGKVEMSAIWGSAPDDLYVVGGPSSSESLILHSTGDGNWTPQNTTSAVPFFSVFGTGKNDIYAGNLAGEIFHSTGDGSWQKQTTTARIIRSIWGSAPDDLWAIDEDLVLRSTGNGTWTPEPKPPGISGFGGTQVIGFGKEHIYIVGRREGVLHLRR